MPNSTSLRYNLPSLKIPYKQVLLTGLTSEMAFFLFPGPHQELRGDSCSIDQSAIDSTSRFDKLLGWVESLGWAWARQGHAIELLTGVHRGAGESEPQPRLNKDEMETLSEADFSTLKEF